MAAWPSGGERSSGLQVVLQLAAVSGENRPKYVVFCAKRGEILARYTEPSGLRLLLPRGELFWSNAGSLVEWQDYQFGVHQSSAVVYFIFYLFF